MASNPVFLSGRGRNINADGTVDIRCRICGRVVLKSANYRGFSTVECYQCHTGLAGGKTEEELIAEAKQRDQDQDREVTETVLDNQPFKALGFRKRASQVMQKIREAVVAKRKPLTLTPDKEPRKKMDE